VGLIQGLTIPYFDLVGIGCIFWARWGVNKSKAGNWQKD